MAGIYDDYRKYEQFYEQFHLRRQAGLTGGNALPQKPAKNSRKNLKYLILVTALLGILLSIVLMYNQEQRWNAIQIKSLGSTVLNGVMPNQKADILESGFETQLAKKFNCRIYNSPWRRSFVTADIYLKGNPDQQYVMDQIASAQEKQIKDVLRNVISAADLYQINDPQLTDIRFELEKQFSQIFQKDLTGKVLIPQWKVRY